MPAEPTQQPTHLLRPDARKGGFSRELPISKQFTPKQIGSLLEFLQIIHEHGTDAGGDDTQVRLRLKERFFADTRRGGTEPKRLTQAGNAMMSARHWGLLSSSGSLTEVGMAALSTGDEGQAVRVMVEHFLRDMGGSYTVKAILDVIGANDGVAPEKTALARSLRAMRIYENSDGTDHSAVLAWLAHPGAQVLASHGGGRWELDEQRFQALAGITPTQVDTVVRRDPVQIALLVELARTPNGRSDSGTMQRLLSLRQHLKVHGPSFKSRYINPLADDGLIQIERQAKGSGATSFSITDLGRSEAVQNLLVRLDADGERGYQATDLLRPLSEILDELECKDQHRRGIALEHLALRMLDWIGLSDLRWRVRPSGNNAEEIDGTAIAALPSLARWQMQAKNTKSLNADDAAKEVGLAIANQAAVVMLITTGRFTPGARNIISRVRERSSLAIVCLNGDDVQEIVADPTKLRGKLERESSLARP